MEPTGASVPLIVGTCSGAGTDHDVVHRIALDQLTLERTSTPPAFPGLPTASYPVSTDAVGVQALGFVVGGPARRLQASGAG